MDIISIIEKKKFKKELTDEEIGFWIEGICDKSIPDYQTSALLMAIRINGMTKEETLSLTKHMLNSGEQLNLSRIQGITCDKHSTGGVGDKTSLALCPMLAAMGLKVAKMSGRGLGFTGGTLDKLESIPGFNVEMSSDAFMDAVNKNGMAIIGQSDKIDPADKILYALRDVTGTVDSVPLITASIMSKKLAAGCDCILLDVKYGNGSFCPTIEDARVLAQSMVEIGTEFGKNVKAEITSMDQPLGLAIGNNLEVKEAVNTLHGNGPKDFTQLCLSSGATMLMQAGMFESKDRAIEAIQQKIDDGSAFEILKKFVAEQNGDISYLENTDNFPVALYEIPVTSRIAGYISKIDAKGLGLISMHLGAGRRTKADTIDPTAGIILRKKVGDYVNIGDELLTMYTERSNMNKYTLEVISCYEFSKEIVKVKPVVEELISYDKLSKRFITTKD